MKILTLLACSAILRSTATATTRKQREKESKNTHAGVLRLQKMTERKYVGVKKGDQKFYPQVSFRRSSMAWVVPHQD